MLSLRKNWDVFCATVSPILNYVDIIVLVEINKKKEENSLYCLDGFCSEFTNRDKRKGGGIAMYIKNHMNYERLNIETAAYENLTVKINSNRKEKIVSGIYRPPNHTENEFIEELLKITSKKGADDDIIILGDVNINIKDSAKNHVLSYQEMLASNGLRNVIKEATRIDLNIGSCTLIVHILVNLSQLKIFSATVQSNISDHYSTIYGIYDVCTTKNAQPLQSHIITRKVNELIRATDWTPILAETDTETLFDSVVKKWAIYTKTRQSSVRRKLEEKVPIGLQGTS